MALQAEENDGWMDLPGPAHWWPDEPGYYRKHGFEPIGPAEDHLEAIKTLGLKKAPHGWGEACLHGKDDYDLIWNRSFGRKK